MSYQRSKFYSYFVTFWEEGQNDKMEFLIAEMCEHIFFCAELEDWGSFPSRDFLLVSYLSESAQRAQSSLSWGQNGRGMKLTAQICGM
jgi:hypothetical protein